MRCRPWLLGTLIVLLLVFLLLSLPWPGLTFSNFYRIRNGMTLSDVEGILGGPGEMGWFPHTGADWGDEPDPSTWIWWDRRDSRDRVTITVRLDSNKRVREKEYKGPPAGSYLDFLRNLLPWWKGLLSPDSQGSAFLADRPFTCNSTDFL
jgi:hypothetical protein